jgi:hypothetical protein
MYRVLANNAFYVSFYGWPQATRFLQAYSGVKVGGGYRLVLPVASYQSWRGRKLDGEGIVPRCRCGLVLRGCDAGQRFAA